LRAAITGAAANGRLAPRPDAAQRQDITELFTG
jgi:hypothetical protein